MRCIRLELRNVRALSIDVASGVGAEAAAGWVLEEVQRCLSDVGEAESRRGVSTDLEVVVASSGQRFVPRLVQSAMASSAGAASPPAVRAVGTYVVTGGTGGLGLVTAKWLVERGARHIVLLSRSGRRSDGGGQDDWEYLCRCGAEVLCLRCDVSDEAAVALALKRVRECMPPVTGVVHAAGVLDDGALRNLTRARFERVFGPKVDAAWYLHKHTLGDDLTMFVLYSSIASVLGSAGQGNYCAANSCLDALALYRRGLNLCGSSIQWGPWAGVGMAAKAGMSNRLLQSGFDYVKHLTGMEACANILSQSRVVQSVFHVDWAAYMKGFVFIPPFFEFLHSKIDYLESRSQSEFESADGRTFQKRTRLTGFSVADVLKILLDTVIEITGSIVLPNSKFSDLIMDSLAFVEMRGILSVKFGGKPFPASFFYDFPTFTALASHLAYFFLADDQGLIEASGQTSAVSSIPSNAVFNHDTLLGLTIDAVSAAISHLNWGGDIKCDLFEIGMSSNDLAEVLEYIRIRIPEFTPQDFRLSGICSVECISGAILSCINGLSAIIISAKPVVRPSLHVIFLPPVNGTCSIFFAHARYLPEGAKVHFVELPGSIARPDDTVPDDGDNLIDYVASEIIRVTADGIPYVTVGYSFGALLCYHASQRIALKGGVSPKRIFVIDQPRILTSELISELHDIIIRYGADPTFMKESSRRLQNFHMPEKYQNTILSPDGILAQIASLDTSTMLACPVTVFHAQLSNIKLSSLLAWCDVSVNNVTGLFALHVIGDCDHITIGRDDKMGMVISSISAQVFEFTRAQSSMHNLRDPEGL